jgi:hypothetical protein
MQWLLGSCDQAKLLLLLLLLLTCNTYVHLSCVGTAAASLNQLMRLLHTSTTQRAV